MIDFEFNESQKMILSSLEKTLNENFDIRSENKKVEGLEYSNHGWEEIKNLGFSIHRTGQMSFFEQIYLFNNAKIIVGAHGAAFTNLIFCKPKTKVIEIIPKSHPSTVNKKISKVKNLNYFRFLTKELKENEKINGDIIVNTNTLKKILN